MFSYAGNPPIPGAVALSHDEIKQRHTVCPSSACGERLHFRFPSQDGLRAGHWAHSPDSQCPLARTSNVEPEAEWCLSVRKLLSGPSASHEVVVDGGSARCDVVVSVGNERWAVEIQHSPISRETVRRRIESHREAGLSGTLWLVDASTVGMSNLNLGTQPHPSSNEAVGIWTNPYECNWNNALGGVRIRQGWEQVDSKFGSIAHGPSISELCLEASDEGDYPVSVVLLSQSRGSFTGRALIEGCVVNESSAAGWRVLNWANRVLTNRDLVEFSHGDQSQSMNVVLHTQVDNVEKMGPDTRDTHYIVPLIDGEVLVSTTTTSTFPGSKHRQMWRTMTPQGNPQNQQCPCKVCSYRRDRGLRSKHRACRATNSAVNHNEFLAAVLSIRSDAVLVWGSNVNEPPIGSLAEKVRKLGLPIRTPHDDEMSRRRVNLNEQRSEVRDMQEASQVGRSRDQFRH